MKKRILFSLLPLLPLTLIAQVNHTSQLTIADYERLDSLHNLDRAVYCSAVEPQWIGDTNTFWYVNKEKEGNFYYVVDAETRQKGIAFSTDKLTTLLAKETKEVIPENELALTNLRFIDKEEIRFSAYGGNWKYLIKQNKLSRFIDNSLVEKTNGRKEYRMTNSVVSPDNLWEAYIKDNNIYIKRTFHEEEIALTRDGTTNNYYSSQLIWSPDSKKLASVKIRDVETRRIPLIESAPDYQLQPVLRWRNYAKPGDVLPITLPVLFDIATQKQISLDTDLYTNQYYLRIREWRQDSRGFTFEFNERGHQRYIIGEVNATSGKIHHVVDEQSDTFIYYNKLYSSELNDGAEVIWISERDGWRHIYLIDGITGQIKKQVTKGKWIVREILQVYEKERYISFTASGIKDGEDPYNVHYCRINFDGSGFMDLTPENGNHTVSFSPDLSYYVDTYSRPDLPPVSTLKRTSDTSLILKLEEGDISDLLAKGWVVPEVFQAKGRDGETDIWGTIFRPSHFDPSKKYPVIEMIYAGPHDSHVDKNFSVVHNSLSKLVELGFIVVTIDGMGTYNRSKAFHDVCWKNLKDAGFPDRKLWIKAAAGKYPYMDISKVGIYGWSAGGQNAMAALLFHNDFYKVAVSFCGCHDNRVDKMWWNEQWMGYPVDESYSASSNVDNAHLLKGKLLLINGELDDNVDPTSTLQVVAALVKAGKNFEQLYLPGRGHSLGSDYETRRMHDFFVKNLLGQNPPEW